MPGRGGEVVPQSAEELIEGLKKLERLIGEFKEIKQEKETRMAARSALAKERKAVLAQLEKLAGATFQEGDITFEGTRLVIPARMSAKKALDTLAAYVKQQETLTSWNRTYQYRPWDGAAAFERALLRLQGTTGIQKGSFSFFFGHEPPQRYTVKVGVNETIDVPWGGVRVELFGDDGVAYLKSSTHPELGPLFLLEITAARKYRAAAEGLFTLIDEELERHSIYRGKAFDGQTEPDFVDLRGVDPKKVVYSSEVTEQLEANVWSLLHYPEEHRELGIPLKRSVLLEGPYGTGKTLAAFLTAQQAVAEGWTFVYCRPGKDDLHLVMQTARLYQPSVVFFEDVDVISDTSKGANTSGVDEVSKLLDVFDGITAKGTELMAILTTNHPERIHKGMVRPGRLDAVIHIGALDAGSIEELTKAVVPESLLGDVDYALVGKAMDGFMPAFVKEAIDRAMRYAITRTGGRPETLETDDFVMAAEGLRPQLDMMEGASEHMGGEPLLEGFRQLMAEEIRSNEGKWTENIHGSEVIQFSAVNSN